MQAGHQRFLKHATVLETTLLNYLDTITLFRLAHTCRSLQEWLLGLPLTVWQVRQHKRAERLGSS